MTYQVQAETEEGLQALREKIKVNEAALWEEGVFMEWACMTPTHRSGRQTGAHQTFFLRKEALPALLEAMANRPSDSKVHWRGCVNWAKKEKVKRWGH